LAISFPHRADRVAARATRARLRPRVGLVVAAVFVVATGLFALSRSSVFALRHVEVEGAGHRSVAEIRSLAAIPSGTNVAWADTGAIERRLLADPWIRSARVTRSLPWTIDIAVRQRTPVAVLDPASGGTLVAGDGTLLGPDDGVGGVRLPAIAGAPAASATDARPDVTGAVRALDAMAPSVRRRVREVGVTIGGTLTLRLRGGAEVDLGSAVNLEAKGVALRRVLVWARRSGRALASVSVLAPDAPAATFVG